MSSAYGRPPDPSLENYSIRRHGNSYHSRYSRGNRTMTNQQLNPNAPPFIPHNFDYHDTGYSNQTERSQQYSRSNKTRRGINRSNLTGETSTDESGESLRVRLIDQLETATCECAVCCEVVERFESIWSCESCYHIFHLVCIQQWAASCHKENVENPTYEQQVTNWRCPSCQFVRVDVPSVYRCFCRKYRNPRGQSNYDTPHSCGKLCQKRRPDTNCQHPCTLQCHPGPCPSCAATVKRACQCGKSERRVRCGIDTKIQCPEVCGLMLNCDIHQCDINCHPPPCTPCSEVVHQKCYCQRQHRDVSCSKDVVIPDKHSDDAVLTTGQFSCGATCDKLLDCGSHRCLRVCHPSDCGSCPNSPDRIQRCPCGRKSLKDLLGGGENNLAVASRTKCTDPIPCCNQKCSKVLPCSIGNSIHLCEKQCHQGDCPPCEKEQMVECRCTKSQLTVPCKDYVDSGGEPKLCTRKCQKKLSCKSHRCNAQCCVDREHHCMQICGNKLNCGVHSCSQLCHAGKCNICMEASFNDLYCHCEYTHLRAPIRCGTQPPKCDQICVRTHQCSHPVMHNCHADTEACAACTYLTTKWCYGQHMERYNIPCHLRHVSCGLPCNVRLVCGVHGCPKPCHEHTTSDTDVTCRQLCPTAREHCGHPCAEKCHGETTCPPDAKCRTEMRVSCECGTNKQSMLCFAVDELIAIKKRQHIISFMASASAQKPIKLENESYFDICNRYLCLGCNELCAQVERNRKLAGALDLSNDTEVRPQLKTPTYQDSLKEFCKNNFTFVVKIEDSFCDLIEKLTQSSHPSRSHVFPPMNGHQRKFIHEYANFFQFDTQSFDPDPKRNVVATAFRSRSCIPSKLLSNVVKALNDASGSEGVMPGWIRL